MSARAPLLALLVSLGGCAEPEPLASVAELRAPAEDALRALGEGRFEVIELRPDAVSAFDVVDDYRYRSRFHALAVDAKVRCKAPLSVEGEGEIDEHIGQQGWSIDDSDRALSLLALLGPGERRAGEVVEIHAAAVFDELAPRRYRFRAFDLPRAVQR